MSAKSVISGDNPKSDESNPTETITRYEEFVISLLKSSKLYAKALEFVQSNPKFVSNGTIKSETHQLSMLLQAKKDFKVNELPENFVSSGLRAHFVGKARDNNIEYYWDIEENKGTYIATS